MKYKSLFAITSSGPKPPVFGQNLPKTCQRSQGYASSSWKNFNSKTDGFVLEERLQTDSKQKGNIMVLLLVMLLLVVAAAGYIVYNNHKNTSSVNSTSSAAKPAISSSGALSSGTDNASLNSDLNNINGGLNQSNQDLQNTSSALNDQQPTISE